MKVNIRALSASLGIILFAVVLLLGFWFSATGFGRPVMDLAASLYANIVKLNYNPIVSFGTNLSANFLSIVLLSIFAAVDGVILGILFGFLYNFFLPKEK